MKKLLLLGGLILSAVLCHAQAEMPFAFTSEDENRLIKETDSGKYYTASEDSSNVVFLGEETPSSYRVWDKSKHLLAEGMFSTEGDRFLKEGKWTEYYKSGKIKSRGCYQKDNPVGMWEHYYESGRIKKTCNYVMIEANSISYCMAGGYEEYYESGKPKVIGMYKIVFDDRAKDTVMVEDPVTGQRVRRIMTASQPKPEKAGTWEFYAESGELEKKEEH